jgi:hypothetical protein
MTTVTVVERHYPMSPLASLLPIIGVALGQPAAPLAPWEPASGCYIGAYVDREKNCRGDIDGFERLTGRKHASYFRYVGYGEPFPYAWVADLQRRRAAAHIAWEPNHGLDEVKDDDYLRGWAEAARRSGAPIFLRYASEMNGTWQAYSGDAERYKEKWRIVYRVMHEVAPNVAMVWCPFSMPRRTIEPYYPGDETVDWVGVNIYSVHHHDGDPNRPGGEDPRDELQYVYDLYAARKPIQISEFGATHFCGACNTWVPSFAVLRAQELYRNLRTRFPRVKMINWFSVDTIGEGLAANNYSVTENPTLLASYHELIADPYFLDTCPPVEGAAPAIGPIVAERPPGVRQPDVSVATTAETHEAPLAADAARIIILQSGRAVSGQAVVTVEVGEKVPVSWIEVAVDGTARYLSTMQPFRWNWDTRRDRNGEHVVSLVVYDANNRTVGKDALRVTVDNREVSAPAKPGRTG